MSLISIIHIIVSILLVVFILLQQRGTALGSAFGGGSDTFYNEKRGMEKNIFITTVVLAVLFVAISLVNLII